MPVPDPLPAGYFCLPTADNPRQAVYVPPVVPLGPVVRPTTQVRPPRTPTTGAVKSGGGDPTDVVDSEPLRIATTKDWTNAAVTAAGRAGVNVMEAVKAQEARVICSFAKHCKGNTAKDERIIGTGKGDRIRGGGGSDFLEGAGGNDRLFGGAGPDQLFGRIGADKLDGGPGDDEIEGGRGNDTLKGGPGADELNGGFGVDRIFGGAGDDYVKSVGGGSDVVDCGPGRDRIMKDKKDHVRNCEVVLT